MAKILISNRSNVPNGEIISLHEDSEPLGVRETMQNWISAGNNKETWSGSFVMVHVSDKSSEDILFLKEKLIKEVNGELESIGNKYYFQRPNDGSDLFNAFDQAGQVSVPWSVAETFLLEHS